jgi:hypothetical protein
VQCDREAEAAVVLWSDRDLCVTANAFELIFCDPATSERAERKQGAAPEREELLGVRGSVGVPLAPSRRADLGRDGVDRRGELPRRLEREVRRAAGGGGAAVAPACGAGHSSKAP